MNNNGYKVSIRLMTYMHEPYIRQAMDGIMMQRTNFKVEVVIGDDFSTDNTLDLIRLYQNTSKIQIKILEREKGDRYWIKRQKAGRLYNFIDILDNCKGKYIALLDGDDHWTDPLKLQKQVDFLEANQDFSGVFHNVGFIDERKENQKITPWRTYNQDVFTARDTIRKLSLFHTSSYCFRNIKFDKSLFLNPKVKSGDMLLLGLIAKHGKLKLLDEMMSVYRKNDGGVTSNETQIEYHKNRVALNKTLNAYFDYKYKGYAKNIIDYHIKEIQKLKYPKLFKFKNQLKRLKS